MDFNKFMRTSRYNTKSTECKDVILKFNATILINLSDRADLQVDNPNQFGPQYFKVLNSVEHTFVMNTFSSHPKSLSKLVE